MTRLPRLLLVGCGRMGTHHLQALGRTRHFDLAGVCDLSPLRFAAASVPGWTSLGEALAAARPDAALLAVPPQAHEACARLCLEHGVPVLLEKPLTPSHAASTALVRDFAARGIPFQPAMVERFNPAWRAFLAHRDRLGRLLRLDIRRLGNGTRPEHAAEVGSDLAIHDLDLLAQVLPGLQPHEARRRDGELRMRMSTPEGCAILLQARWNSIKPQRRWRIEGETGCMELDFRERTATLDGIPVDTTGEDPLEAQLRAFAQALDGLAAPGTESALKAQEWLDYPTNATASISTLTSRGRRPTSMVERAGA